MKVTNEQVITFRNNTLNYRRMYNGKFSPFLYCLEKIMARTKSIQEEYDEDAREINQDLAEKKDGFFVMEKFGKDDSEERYKISSENTKKRDSKIKELLKKQVEVEPYLLQDMTTLPKDIGFDWWNVFAPFVLPELTDDEAEKLFNK